MSNKITITLQAKTDDAKKNIASLEKDIKSLTTSIKSQSEIQKTHYSNIKSALNEQNKENENFAKRRQQIIQDTITSNRQLEESMKAKSNPLKEQLNAIEQAKSKMQNEQKALLSSLGGDSTKANAKEKEQLSKREQDLNNHISEIKRLKKELTEVTRSQDYQDLSNQISNNKKLKTEQLEKLQAEKQLYNQSAKLKIDNLKQEQNLNAQGLADNRKVLSEKQALLQKEINVYKEKEQALRKSILGMSFGITPEASKSAYLAKTSQANTQSLVNERAAVDATEKSYSNLANTTIRYLRWAGTIAGVFYGVQRAWQMTLGAGIDVNKMIEDNTSGIAALISANTRMALSNGQMVNSYEKFQIASGKAASIMEELRVASIKTYATFPQLTSIYQQMIGHTMSMGNSMGKTVNEISTNTIELSKILSNIGGAIGMEMQKVNEEARSIISGSASTDSLIAMMVFGSPTQANQAMKKAKEAGVNGVKDMLMGVLESYKVLEGVKTYTRAQLELQDQISRSQEHISKPTYNALKDV